MNNGHFLTRAFQTRVAQFLIIVTAGFLVYSNTFHVPFIFDDERYIVNNPLIKNLAYFCDPYHAKDLHTLAPTLEHAFITRLFGQFTFAVNYRLGQLNVTGYHAVNLLVHLAGALLLYTFVALTFRTPYFSVRSQTFTGADEELIAFFSALFFVVHPLQTQAVTYITQRFTSLATLLYLVSLCAYIKSRLSQTNSARYAFYGASIISAVLGMMTKEIVFTLPVVIALYEVMFFEGKMKKMILNLVPFFLAIPFIPITLLMADGSITDIKSFGESMKTLASSPTLSSADYLFTQFRVIVTYIRLLLFPVNQNLDYDYPVYHSFFDPNVFLSFLFLLAILGFGIYCLYRSRLNLHPSSLISQPSSRLIAFGIFWFLTTLMVESSVIPIADVIFEHRVYLPSAGFFISFITIVIAMKNRIKARVPAGESAIMPALLILSFILAGLAYARNTTWQDELILWQDTAGKSPRKPRPHGNLGVYYDRENRPEDAIREYQLAIRLDPDYAEAHGNLGITYAKQGRLEEAINEYQSAIRLNPNDASTHTNLGVVYDKLGHREKAIEEYQRTLSIRPDDAKAHTNLGAAYYQMGNLREAIRELQIAIKYDLGYVDAHYDLAIIYKDQGDLNNAIKEMQTVIDLNPNDLEAAKILRVLKLQSKMLQ